MFEIWSPEVGQKNLKTLLESEVGMHLGPQFIIVSGALGSGKTSLIENLLRCEDATDTAVIVNEAGEINIDGAILSESAKGMSMATLSNGCVCCSMRSDLVTTVYDIIESRRAAGQPDLTRIVLECSGLSRPGPIVASLQELASLKLRLKVVTTYDCSRPPLQYEGFDDAVAQLVAADTVVLTKQEVLPVEHLEQALRAVKAINPLALIVDFHDRAFRAREAFIAPEHILKASPDLVPLAQVQSRVLLHPRVRVFRARINSSMIWEDTLDWLENITGALGERLLRIKAIVPGANVGDRVLLQSVGTTFSAPRALQEKETPVGAIVIARDCSKSELEEVQHSNLITWAIY